jgi:hypothetical protein
MRQEELRCYAQPDTETTTYLHSSRPGFSCEERGCLMQEYRKDP